MKICHVITRLINGGADENTVLSCNYQAQKGNKVTLIYGNDYHDQIIKKLDKNVELICVSELRRSIHPYYDLMAYRQILKIFKRLSPDVVHTHTSKAGIIGRLAAHQADTQIIIHGVHILPFSNVGFLQKFIYVYLEKIVASMTDQFICVSQALIDENVANGIAPVDKHIVVPSGMDVSRFQNATPINPSEIIPDQFCSEDKKYIVYVGALEQRKRQVETVSVFKKVITEFPNAVLLLVGGGQDEELISNKISELSLKESVFMIGFREDVERIIKLADVCILSSKREGLARVLIQYCLSGKPIVSTRLPGTNMIIDEGKNGFLVEPDNLQQMHQEILKILKDSELAKSFGQHSSKKNLEEWSDQAMGLNIEKTYIRLMNQTAS